MFTVMLRTTSSADLRLCRVFPLSLSPPGAAGVWAGAISCFSTLAVCP